MAETLETCCLCGHKLPSKEMHNAAPVVDKGVCCENCHKARVMYVRCINLLAAVYRA